ncbi:MAG TPA: SURF1 family protein [Anaerolineales bacterium]|nr:SURF1 family protein [Anaerolineales bacterium]
MLFRSLFSRRWWFTTLLVIAGTLVLIRLGIWQLDRLEGRRAFNAQVLAARSLPPLDLNAELPENLDEMEWRSVQLTGTYDFENQIALRNRYHQEQLGYHLITPLRISGTAVLVDRGWIPADSGSASEDWRAYDEPREASIMGQIRLGLEKPSLGGVDDPPFVEGERLLIWNNLDLARIARQMPYPIQPVVVQPDAIEGDVIPPIPFQPEQDLTEGSHFGYALQWFTFAGILFFGYPFFLLRQEQV